jgi:hypothetical protein
MSLNTMAAISNHLKKVDEKPSDPLQSRRNLFLEEH